MKAEQALDQPTTLRSAELDSYFAAVHIELKQLGKLVNHAVDDLVARFKCVHELSARQHDALVRMLGATAKDSSANDDETHLLVCEAEVQQEIEQQLNDILTSLQFGDLATQLLEHIGARMRSLNTALQYIAKHASPDCVAGGMPSVSVDAAAAAVAAANRALCSKPVAQHGVQIGDVELF